MKRAIRSEMQQKLKLLTKEYVELQSLVACRNLFSLPQFENSKAFSVYLSMGGEIDTEAILEKGFANNKRVYIPKITGKKSEDMFMLEVANAQTINSFAKNSWGIPEPSMDLIRDSVDGTSTGIIDLILLPGVAFDSSCNRLGHGKGYYGKILYLRCSRFACYSCSIEQCRTYVQCNIAVSI